MYCKNVPGQNLGFRLLSAGTGSPLLGATVTVYRTVDGGAQAQATGVVSEKGFGQYNLALSQADTDGDQISFLFTATGAVLEEKTIVTTAANPRDAAAFGLSRLDAAVTSRLAAAAAPANFQALAISSGGLADVNLIQVNGQPAQTSTDPIAANLVQVSGQAISDGAVPATVSGTVPANLIQVGGQAISGGAVPATLVPTGLDAISVADPGPVSQMTSLPRLIVALWRRYYKKTTLDASGFRTYADDGATVNTTQTASDDGTIQIVEAAR